METASLMIEEEGTGMEPASAFRELYELHSRAIYLTALRVTGNPADAEDVLQTVFLRVLDGHIELDETRSPAGYLRRAAANAAIDVLRRKRTRRETDIDEGVEHSGRGHLRLAGPADAAVLLKDRLRQALTRLPRENAELFVLCYLEGYSYDELAELMGLERGTVGSRLHRIRATLREELSDYEQPSG